MPYSHSAPVDGAPRRVVLVDFDWRDADLVPALLRRPAITIGLIAGEGPDDPGVRLAELCGVPHTVELSDLTREIFDLALIGEHSPRRDQLERVLGALGTPVALARDWLDPPSPVADAASPDYLPDPSAATAARSVADLNDLLPDFPSAGTPGTGQDLAHEPDAPVEADSGLPGAADHQGLERTLDHWAAATEARGAEIHVQRAGEEEQVCRSGAGDPMLSALVKLATDLGQPHVMSQLEGPQQGKAWGAWPIRTSVLSGVVAASAIDPVAGRAQWEHLVEDLRTTWDLEDREPALRPAEGSRFAGTARGRLELALARNRAEGLRCEAHRLAFDGTAAMIDTIAGEVGREMREHDFVQALEPGVLLLLCSGPPAAYGRIRRRLVSAWEAAWREGGEPDPAPPFTDEWVEMLDSIDAAGFHAIVAGWIGSTGGAPLS